MRCKAQNLSWTENTFPYFVIDKDLTLTLVKIYLKPKGKESLDTTGLRLKINNIDVGTWDSVAGTNMKVSNVALAGSPNPVMKWSINSGVNGLDKEKLDDILISLAYTASSSP